MTTTFRDPVEIDELTVTTTFSPPPAQIGNGAFSSASADRLVSSKAQHQKTVTWATATTTTTVASVTKSIYLFNASGTIEAVTVRPDTAPTGGDLQYTVDIQKAASGSGSFSSILSSVVTMSSADSDDTEEAASITTTAASAGDCLQIVVTTSGSTGTQGSGASVNVVLTEEPS